MLLGIDCVMMRVDDLDRGVAFYTEVFGLTPTWRDGVSAGLRLPDSPTEVVLHTMELPVSVHYLVADVAAAVAEYVARGCELRVPPFDIAIGRCAVLVDPFGNDLAILDLSRGPRPS